MESLKTGCKRRRQTFHGDEITKVSKTETNFQFKQPLQPLKKDDTACSSCEPRTSSHDTMKTRDRSMSLKQKLTRRKMSADSQLASGWDSLRRSVMKKDMPASLAMLHGTMKTELRRRVSHKVLKHKLQRLQDYSLPDSLVAPNNFDMLRRMGDKENKGFEEAAGASRKDEEMDTSMEEVWVRRTTPPRLAARNALIAITDMNTHSRSPQTSTRAAQRFAKKTAALKDADLQQKIDHEIKMREGTAKLLAASKHPNQVLEAARSLLCSNSRIMAYMTELQRRKTQEVLGHSQLTEGNQLPCRAQVNVSDIRIPLMWKDTDHFKNKGDYRQYAVFCLLKVGTEIFDTSMIADVDRSMTDITFEDVVLFHDVPHDFELKVEVYCHKLQEELCVANTPKKIRKKITDLSGSVGRSVGKRLSGLNDADVIGSMVLGPRFELVAKGKVQLQDVDDSVRTFDFELERNSEGKEHELPLFGNYCCRVAAIPDCLTKPAVSGFLNIPDDSDRTKWRHYWCVLKNLQLACWSSPADADFKDSVLSIPVTKSTQISEADPSSSKRAHTFLIKTVSPQGVSQHTLAADSKDEVNTWWDGFQQHLLDQALWKHACDEVMLIKAPTKTKVGVLRKSSLYEDTPIADPDSTSDGVFNDTRMDDDQLSQMLAALMADDPHFKSVPGHSGASS